MKQLLLLIGIISAMGCPNNPTPDEIEIDETIYAQQLGGARANATTEQQETFDRGLKVALHRFDTDDGLGPHFNVSFCASCHEKPFFGGTSPRYRDFNIVGAKLEDGSVIPTGVNGVQPQFSTAAPHRMPTDPATNLFARRNAIPFFGIGALAAIDEDAILANEDPDDSDGDGISGRANYDEGFVGRFGRKAQTVSIEGFIRGPLFNHLGITTNPLSEEKKLALPIPSPSADADMTLRSPLPCFTCQAAAPDEPNTDDDDVPDPELSEDDLFDLVSFSMLIGAPKPEPFDARAENGLKLFREANCSGCHVESLAGPNGQVFAYTDLLLHDMGDELADGVTQGLADGNEFRTQPLWGVVATAPYLHDGRAETLDDAIRLHGGESEDSRDKYVAMSDQERDDLLHFLASLGGREHVNEGLINANDRLPEVGEIGGPIPGADVERFAAGRRVFDRDITMKKGLGSFFNGDSCRACHFEPQIGGAGPVGVNVIREGKIENGIFSEPGHGTLLHRFSVNGERPEPDPDSNVYELRQTPPMFGLGLVDQIEDATILALADPNDLDGDGIAGIARMMDDGRVGKFGWKSGLPTLEDFVRDAISNELGLTISAAAGFIAGFDTDDDDIQDPELAQNDYEDLVFFAKALAPPPQRSNATTAEGRSVFSAVGCDGCHIPSLPTATGESVKLFSDLLLHNVQADDHEGIEDGPGAEYFRTTPLWGLSKSGPYWHDGLSPTIEHSIDRHQGEASHSIELYNALSDDERAVLMAFLESL